MRRAVSFVLLACAAGCGRGVEEPTVDRSGMEASVVEALEGAQRAVEDAPASADAWGELGMTFQAHALYTQAGDCYREAIARAPDDYRWHYLAGTTIAKSDPRAALPHFRDAAARRPANQGFWMSYARLLSEAGEDSAAEVIYSAVLEKDASLAQALYGLAFLEFRRGEMESAREHIDRAVTEQPHYGEAHALRAQIHARLGDAETAERAALVASAYPDETPAPDPVMAKMQSHEAGSRAFTRRGLALEAEGRYVEAEAAFRKVLEIRPGNARDHSNLGGVLARMGRTEEALEQYRLALQVNPDEAWAHNNLALALASSGRIDEAIDHFRRALKTDPGYADAHYNLGLIHARAGRLQEAIAKYREALAHQPTHLGALNALGMALTTAGQPEEAIESWRLAVAIDPVHIDSLYNLAVALIPRGRHAAAIDLLRQALHYAPNSSLVSRTLAWELATAPDETLRDGAEALRLASRVHARYSGQPLVADIMAAAQAEAGLFDEAVTTAAEASRLALQADQPALARQIRERLEGYRQRRPYRQAR